MQSKKYENGKEGGAGEKVLPLTEEQKKKNEILKQKSDLINATFMLPNFVKTKKQSENYKSYGDFFHLDTLTGGIYQKGIFNIVLCSSSGDGIDNLSIDNEQLTIFCVNNIAKCVKNSLVIDEKAYASLQALKNPQVTKMLEIVEVDLPQYSKPKI